MYLLPGMIIFSAALAVSDLPAVLPAVLGAGAAGQQLVSLPTAGQLCPGSAGVRWQVQCWAGRLVLGTIPTTQLATFFTAGTAY